MLHPHALLQLLSLQHPVSADAGSEAHDEHLFIVIHQVIVPLTLGWAMVLILALALAQTLVLLVGAYLD